MHSSIISINLVRHLSYSEMLFQTAGEEIKKGLARRFADNYEPVKCDILSPTPGGCAQINWVSAESEYTENPVHNTKGFKITLTNLMEDVRTHETEDYLRLRLREISINKEAEQFILPSRIEEFGSRTAAFRNFYTFMYALCGGLMENPGKTLVFFATEVENSFVKACFATTSTSQGLTALPEMFSKHLKPKPKSASMKDFLKKLEEI